MGGGGGLEGQEERVHKRSRLECSQRRQGAQKEEKKGKEKRTNESEAMIADVSHRCATGGFTFL